MTLQITYGVPTALGGDGSPGKPEGGGSMTTEILEEWRRVIRRGTLCQSESRLLFMELEDALEDVKRLKDALTRPTCGRCAYNKGGEICGTCGGPA